MLWITLDTDSLCVTHSRAISNESSRAACGIVQRTDANHRTWQNYHGKKNPPKKVSGRKCISKKGVRLSRWTDFFFSLQIKKLTDVGMPLVELEKMFWDRLHFSFKKKSYFSLLLKWPWKIFGHLNHICNQILFAKLCLVCFFKHFLVTSYLAE